MKASRTAKARVIDYRTRFNLLRIEVLPASCIHCRTRLMRSTAHRLSDPKTRDKAAFSCRRCHYDPMTRKGSDEWKAQHGKEIRIIASTPFG